MFFFIKRLGVMKKILVFPMFVVLAFAISISIPQVYATPAITLNPTSGHVGITVTVSGNGFIAEEGQPVYVFFDNTQKDSVTVASDGTFTIGFAVPPASLGVHTISISDNPSSTGGTFLLASAQFTVTGPSIPEFPFSFSMVIIFVTVTAVYLVIRQKMAVNWKPF